MVIVVPRLKGNNETLLFTSNIYKGARLVEYDLEYASFTNFAIDSVSVEAYDILQTLYEFLNGKNNHFTTVDNKHNAKNNRYQFIGELNAVLIENYCINTNLLLIAKVLIELIVLKDFTSDKKIKQLFLCNTISFIEKEINNCNIIGLERDYGVLYVILYFSRLYLYTINGINLLLKHRAIYLGISMFWFTSIWAINQIPKRNLIIESIGNMFLGKFLFCIFKLCFKTSIYHF